MSKIWDIVLKNMKKTPEQETGCFLEQIPSMKLLEFENLVIEVFSEVLQQTFWLCSDEEMKAQIERDAPSQVLQTVPELQNLLKLNPSAQDIKRIHKVKKAFHGSIVLTTTNK